MDVDEYRLSLFHLAKPAVSADQQRLSLIVVCSNAATPLQKKQRHQASSFRKFEASQKSVSASVNDLRCFTEAMPIFKYDGSG